jgi:hypothetical protein
MSHGAPLLLLPIIVVVTNNVRNEAAAAAPAPADPRDQIKRRVASQPAGDRVPAILPVPGPF